MAIMVATLAFLLAALCAGVMGFAIQRGATCTVAAVTEVVNQRKFNRLSSMVEASIWVAGCLLLAQTFHVLERMPAGYPLNRWTVIGAALLGLGAFVNGACVFGAIARLGSGEWAYAVTPLGFYAGCLTLPYLFSVPPHQRLPGGSVVLAAPPWVAGLFVAFALWRLLWPVLAPRPDPAPARWLGRVREGLGTRVWSPHAATTVIGITFFCMMLLVGAWAYTETLAELARAGMAGSLVPRLLLLLAMFLGALVGGLTAGRFASTRISLAQVLKCLAGGMLMGWGTLLIPGANDGLILVAMPLLWPYAWIAFATMCLSIGIALLAKNALAEPMARQRASK
jgi:hypothetical protein